MMNQKTIRIILTALVLFVGGYFIQQSSLGGNVVNNVVDKASADAAAPAGDPYGGSSGL